ncbi:MAG: 4-hydroxy-tetrahydrodipicolinate reductase [Bacillota bacterium]
MMQIGIAGYGKMGKMIYQLAREKGHEVPLIIDPQSTEEEVTARKLDSTSPQLDVIIDFTTPETVLDNIKDYGQFELPAVIGTTGWYDQMEQVARIVKDCGIGLIWSGNFSLGVNLFFQLVKAAGNLINRFPEYDVMVHEYHHRQKADSPSGTAQMIGDILVDSFDWKTLPLSKEPHRKLKDCELQISSTRGGFIPGTHQVIFDSEVDTIALEHCARNRTGFAKGAIMAAEWIKNRKGFYNIDDMMQSIIKGE